MAKEEHVPNRKRQGSDGSFCYELISLQLAALPETQIPGQPARTHERSTKPCLKFKPELFQTTGPGCNLTSLRVLC